ncbi:MAG: alkaline phosphatase family protein [Planctomycetia bacterium]|nr:alkaline phosphatase family protein [Planctomycetia bacterium]
MRKGPLAILLVLCLIWASTATAAGVADYVIQISVDGLGSSYLQSLINEEHLPNFKRLQTEGVWTHNARTDFDYTITLPNHTCMITGRPVMDKAGNPTAIAGHTWVVNSDPGDKTIHSNRHDYVKSTFDVAHDNGLRTCMFASKSKFILYDQSYDARNGAPDTIGADNGRDKIDLYVKDGNSAAMTDRFLAEMKANPFQYSFLHFHDADTAGHAKTWGSTAYNGAIKAVDGYLGKIFELIATDEMLNGKTAVILSADHGGYGLDHGNNRNPLNYTIPFYAWGAGVGQGKDLYALNTATRHDPLSGRPDYTDGGLQPIRNGDGGNLALMLLGLSSIPDSIINASQNLNVR